MKTLLNTMQIRNKKIRYFKVNYKTSNGGFGDSYNFGKRMLSNVEVVNFIKERLNVGADVKIIITNIYEFNSRADFMNFRKEN